MLCLLLACALAPHVEAGALRPYAARHQAAPKHAKPVVHAAAPVKPVVAATPPVVEEAVAEAEAAGPIALPVAPLPKAEPATPEIPAAPVATEGKADKSYSAVKQLHSDLAEMKQLNGNIKTLEQTLAADVTLLRESANLERVSTSARGRKAAKEQVKQAEEMVKDTEAMVKRSRSYAKSAAHRALSEAQAARKAADALSAEASTQLKGLKTRSVAAVQTQKKASRQHIIRLAQIDTDDDSDDDSDEDDKDE